MKFHKKIINALSVQLQGSQIGIINRLAGDRYIFSFEQSYIDNPERSTLSLSFKGQGGGLVTSQRVFTLRLPPFFSNLLPEGHMRAYLAERAGVKPEHEFSLLAALGFDLPGALTVTPLEADEHAGEYLMDASGHFNDSALHFSLAGIQLKFSAIMEAAGGLTIPANGMGGSWIVKLPSNRFPLVTENEFVMLALARAIGIQLPKNQLIDVQAIHGLPKDAAHVVGSALAVERFDRRVDGARIHMEDFAQVFNLFPGDKYNKYSYANIAAVLWAEAGEADTHEFFRRLVFSVLIGNADMHLKNWSLIYADGRSPSLSPAYDFVSTIPYIRDDQLALSFGGSKKIDEITKDQVRRFADVARISANPLKQLVLETVENTVLAWGELKEKALLSEALHEAITRHMQSVAGRIRALWAE